MFLLTKHRTSFIDTEIVSSLWFSHITKYYFPFFFSWLLANMKTILCSQAVQKTGGRLDLACGWQCASSWLIQLMSWAATVCLSLGFSITSSGARWQCESGGSCSPCANALVDAEPVNDDIECSGWECLWVKAPGFKYPALFLTTCSLSISSFSYLWDGANTSPYLAELLSDVTETVPAPEPWVMPYTVSAPKILTQYWWKFISSIASSPLVLREWQRASYSYWTQNLSGQQKLKRPCYS